MDAFTLVNDVVTSIISVLHSFGLMDFRCGGLDLSTLCDKLSCFNASSARDRPLQRLIWEDQQVLITILVAGPNVLPDP